MELNLTIPTGVTWAQSFVWRDPQGNRISLAGLEAKLQCRNRAGGSIFLELSTAAGTIVLEDEAVQLPDEDEPSAVGVFTLRIPEALSAPITVAQAVYDCRFTTPASETGEPVYRPIRGSVVFQLAVTK